MPNRGASLQLGTKIPISCRAEGLSVGCGVSPTRSNGSLVVVGYAVSIARPRDHRTVGFQASKKLISKTRGLATLLFT